MNIALLLEFMANNWVINLFYQKDGYLYLLVDAFKFFEEGARPPFADLTEDSNPVLVKLKLK